MTAAPMIRGCAALLLAFTATFSLASGSDGSAGSETGDTAAYNSGKAVFAGKLACQGCPMAGKSLDSALARQLLATTPASLSAQESQALSVYLKRRFKL